MFTIPSHGWLITMVIPTVQLHITKRQASGPDTSGTVAVRARCRDGARNRWSRWTVGGCKVGWHQRCDSDLGNLWCQLLPATVRSQRRRIPATSVSGNLDPGLLKAEFDRVDIGVAPFTLSKTFIVYWKWTCLSFGQIVVPMSWFQPFEWSTSRLIMPHFVDDLQICASIFLVGGIPTPLINIGQ